MALTRSFDLDIRAAYVVVADPTPLKLEPGAVGKLRLNADRMKTFDGDVTVQLSPSPGLTFPDRIVIPRGQGGVDIEISADPSLPTGRRSINMNASAEVDGFEEEQRGRFDVDLMKAPASKK